MNSLNHLSSHTCFAPHRFFSQSIQPGYFANVWRIFIFPSIWFVSLLQTHVPCLYPLHHRGDHLLLHFQTYICDKVRFLICTIGPRYYMHHYILIQLLIHVQTYNCGKVRFLNCSSSPGWLTSLILPPLRTFTCVGILSCWKC